MLGSGCGAHSYGRWRRRMEETASGSHVRKKVSREAGTWAQGKTLLHRRWGAGEGAVGHMSMNIFIIDK